MQLTIHRFELSLKHPFTISRETITCQPTLIVELSHQGERGFGEATTNRYYGVTMDRLIEQVLQVRDMVESHPADEPVELWERLAGPLAGAPFALCAIDQAAHDLCGKLHGKPLHVMWGTTKGELPVSNFTIGIDSIDRMVAKLQEVPDWPVYKIKLGTDQDLQIIRELRRHTDARFRVDANCGWQVEQAIEMSHLLGDYGVEFIEQPLPAEDVQGQERLFSRSALPLMADESCQRIEDVAACAGRYHGVNIKLVKCGGLTPARRMIAAAREFGLKTMVGCMTESTVGISAIAQLLPELDYVDMDGAALLAEDIATGARVERGICHYGDRPGTGAMLGR